MSDFQTLSYAEVENDLGLSNIIHAGESDADNPVAEFMASNNVQTDRDGRQIISYHQFVEFSRRSVRLDNYAMKMRWPGKRGSRTIQASKYLKWLGAGYIPVGVNADDMENFGAEMQARYAYDAEVLGTEFPVRRRTKFNASVPEEAVDLTIYRCSDKYADCARFFDSSKGLKTHWGKDHGEWGKDK